MTGMFLANTILHELLGHQIGGHFDGPWSMYDDTPVLGYGWGKNSAWPYTNYGQLPPEFLDNVRYEIRTHQEVMGDI